VQPGIQRRLDELEEQLARLLQKLEELSRERDKLLEIRQSHELQLADLEEARSRIRTLLQRLE